MTATDRVMVPSGHAGTIDHIVGTEATVNLDIGRTETYGLDELHRLPTVERRELASATTAPRAWTMGGRVD